MCPVWRPAQSSPTLDRFCHLSYNAQLVMAALYSDYWQRHQHLAQRHQLVADPVSYYQSVYAARFGPSTQISDLTLPSQSPQESQSGNVTCKSYLAFSDLEQKVVKLSHDPSSELLDFCPIQSPNHEDLSQNPIEGPASQVSVEEVGSVRSSKSLSSQPPTSVSVNQLYGPETTAASLQNSTQLDFHLWSDLQSLNAEKCPTSRDEQVIDQTYLNEETISNSGKASVFTRGNNPIEKQLNVCRQDAPCIVGNFNVPKENNEVKTTKTYVDRDRPDRTLIPSDKGIGVYASEIESQAVPLEEEGEEENEDPLELCSKLPVSKPQTSNVRSESLENHSQQLFEVFRKPGEPVSKRSGQSGNTTTPTQALFPSKRDRSNSRTGFSTPFKKSRPNEVTSESSKALLSSQYPCPDHDVLDVSSLSVERRSEVFQSVLSSTEIIITLLYTDGSTELRDNLFGQDNKKRNSGHSKSQCKCKSIVVMYQTEQSKSTNSLLSLPVDLSDELKASIKLFWQKVFVEKMRKICFGAKNFFIQVLSSYGFELNKVDLSWTVVDPGVAHWLLDSDKPVTTFDKLLTAAKFSKQSLGVPDSTTLQQDMTALGVLMQKLYLQLMAKDLIQLFMCVETKLTLLIAAMELREISISTQTLMKFSDLLKKKLCKLEKTAHEQAGRRFLINSHQQLRQVLFEELRLDLELPEKTRLAKTSVGHETSTSEAVLNQLSGYHPLPAIMLQYRQLQKLKSTYIDGILSCVEGECLCTHWEQTAAATGRLTSFQPNLQAIPKVAVTLSGYTDNFISGKESDDTIDIFARDPFKSKDGWSFLAADFQQIELRLLAHLTDDPVLLNIFSNPETPDIFIKLRSQWMGQPMSSVTTSEREQTKRVVYAVMYGAGKEKLAEFLKISSNDAKAILHSFLDKFPAVSQFNKSCIDFVKKHGYTCSIFKRRRMFPQISHPSPVIRAQTERQAGNFCVQGSAADLCKAAMLQIEQELYRNPDLQARLLVQIHDELLLEVLDQDLNKVADVVRCVMEKPERLCGDLVKLKVPVQVSLSQGKTWGHLTPF